MPNYSMPTAQGNHAVDFVVRLAQYRSWNQDEVALALAALAKSNSKFYQQATSSQVRESVYQALGFNH